MTADKLLQHIVKTGLRLLEGSFWRLTLSEDWHFPLAPELPMLPLILKTWAQGYISFACTALKDQSPERASAQRAQPSAHRIPHGRVQAACWQPARAALPGGFRRTPALSGWTCQNRSVGFTPCLTSLIHLTLLSAKAQSSGTVSPQLTHVQ